MKHLERPGEGDGLRREEVADECRAAALAFMTGVASGWEKVDVARWLVGPYAAATRHAPRAAAGAPRGGALVDEVALEALLTRVRGQLLASLERASLDNGSLDLAEESVQRGLVHRVVDETGGDAWVPVDRPRMRLRERVGSLFAADWLNVPHAYLELLVCHRCEAVVFDAYAKRRGMCGAHHLSGQVPSHDDAPISSDAYARSIGR